MAIDCGLEGKASHVKATWHDLKDTYRKKLKMLTPKCGDDGGAKKVCWQWIDKMSILRKFCVVETTTTSNFLTVDDSVGIISLLFPILIDRSNPKSFSIF